MRARLVSSSLVLCLLGTPAFAEPLPTSRFSNAIKTAVANAVASENRQLTQISQGDENPYFVPGLALLGGGGLLLLYGAVHESGAECTSTTSTFNCQTTHSTGVIIAGAAVAGVGGFLLWKGNQHKSSPQLVFGPGQIGVQQRLRW